MVSIHVNVTFWSSDRPGIPARYKSKIFGEQLVCIVLPMAKFCDYSSANEWRSVGWNLAARGGFYIDLGFIWIIRFTSRSSPIWIFHSRAPGPRLYDVFIVGASGRRPYPPKILMQPPRCLSATSRPFRRWGWCIITALTSKLYIWLIIWSNMESNTLEIISVIGNDMGAQLGNFM